jgi:benzoyl-CoA 2,3-dioxygenase component A
MDAAVTVIKQHLIDPEICIRCNTCEATCPVHAITHDDRNYVVRVDVCNYCMACIAPCPTGSIDNWRTVPKAKAYSIEEQLTWDELPAELTQEQLAPDGTAAAATVDGAPSTGSVLANVDGNADTGVDAAVAPLPAPVPPTYTSAKYGSALPPWSAAHAFTNLYGPKAPLTATVTGNYNCTDAGFMNETHHIVLDFGTTPFPVLEGQSIGVIPPGVDANGRPYVARQYSVASPRNGERPGYNNLSLTVKRVTEDHEGRPTRGIASNYLCDLKVGDKVKVIGPFGASFLMPNHPKSNIVMICTGTGSAPMRAMTEWRRRLRNSGKFEGGRLMLFFGARTPHELPYFGPLKNLPKDFIDINLAFSRLADAPKRYVQDLMRERAADLAPLIADPATYLYVCGIKSMEEGVVMALRDVAVEAGCDWDTLAADFRQNGRLHLETY